MRAKNLALRVLSTAAMLSIVTSIAAPAFAATYYINDGSVDVTVSDAGEVTVNQGNKTYTDKLDSVVIRGGTRGDKGDDRIEVGASPATQETDGSNTPAGNETEAPKSENTAGDAAPKQETTAAGERKEGTPQQEPTEEEEEEEEQQEQQEPTEEKVTPEQKPTEKEAEEKETPELVKAKTEAPKATQKPSAEQEEEEEQEEEDEPTVPAAPAKSTDNVITIVNNFVNDAKQVFSFVLDNVNIDRSKEYSYEEDHKAALTVKGKGDTEIELDGDNILKGGYYHAGLEKNDSDGTGTLTIKDDKKAADGSKGSLLAKGGYNGAGIGGGEYQGTSHITVTGGKITAVGGRDGSGIGGGPRSNGTDITIKGDATVIASGDSGAGIGGGGDGRKNTTGYGKVTITDHANVKAWSQWGAGIGGGRQAGGDITISGDATVAAEAHNDSVAIGSGGQLYPSDNYEELNTKITIRDRANVTAVGSGFHPAIGSYGHVIFPDGVSHPFTTTINILGGTLNVINGKDDYYISDVPAIGNQSGDGRNTNADLVLNINASTGNTVINAYTTCSNAATIGKGSTLKKDDEQIQYNADGSSKFGEDGSVVLNLFRNSTTKKTGEKIETANNFWYDLHEIIGGERYDTLHNAQWWMKNHDYTSELATDTNHAWKVDDTKKPVEPTPEHEGHVYYKCSVPGCKAVHDEVLPKLEESKPTPEPTPDPTPVQPEPTPVPTPDPTPVQPEPAPVQPDTPADTQNTAKDDVSTPKLYVIDLANTQVLFDETRQNDTVTYTTKQDGASLTGSFEALEAMAADDVKTIVFQTIGTNTPGAVSRVSVDALLQHGGETLLLTHNGTEVHLTIDGQNVDGLLLQ